MRSKWTRIAGICALLALALPGASALAGHHDLAAESFRLELRLHGLELVQLSFLCLLVALFASDRPAAGIPLLAEVGFVAVRSHAPVASARVRPQPSRGPPA